MTLTDRSAPDVRPGELVRPGLRRWRLWIAVAAVLVVGGFLAAELRTGSDRALDPASSGRSGSKALATVLGGYGVRVRTTTDLASARGRVVVTDPDAYSTDQLRRLDRHADLVLLAPSAGALDALSLPVHPLTMTYGPTDPLCDWPGATAAGSVNLPDGTLGYDGADACYRGAVVRGNGWIVLGSASLLRNDHVADTGVAALDVNAITADRTVSDVTWLLTGTQARSSAAPTTWALFPDGARRAFIWLAAFGVLLVLWQAPRFGRVVTEPLPVVVRSAEVVEGHGRLYLRAGARDRAAAALRGAARQRLAAHLGLRRDAAVRDVVDATAARVARESTGLTALLDGPVPRDDGELLELATALDELERTAGVAVPRSQDLSRGTPT